MLSSITAARCKKLQEPNHPHRITRQPNSPMRERADDLGSFSSGTRRTLLELVGQIVCGGEIGIRTLDTVARMLDFESSAFDHSAISPASRALYREWRAGSKTRALRRDDGAAAFPAGKKTGALGPRSTPAQPDAAYFFAGAAAFAGTAGAAGVVLNDL